MAFNNVFYLIAIVLVIIAMSISCANSIEYFYSCVLLFEVKQCNNVLVKNSMFNSGSSIGCSGIIEHNDFAE